MDKRPKTHLFGVKALSKAFRRLYLDQLIQLQETGQLISTNGTAFGEMIHGLKKKDWIVYAKRPFAGPKQVLDYLGRYTHRVAISNHRLVAFENGQVTFTYRDRADGNQEKRMTLDALEFIRRFLLHVLPRGFVKIRYFGFMAHRHKKKYIALIRSLIAPGMQLFERVKETVSEMMMRLTGSDITRCPRCGKGKMLPWLQADRMPMVKIFLIITDFGEACDSLPTKPISKGSRANSHGSKIGLTSPPGFDNHDTFLRLSGSRAQSYG